MYNPALGEVQAQVPLASKAELDAAVAAEFGIVVVGALVILFGAICKRNRLEVSFWDAPVAGHDEPVADVWMLWKCRLARWCVHISTLRFEQYNLLLLVLIHWQVSCICIKSKKESYWWVCASVC